MLNRFPNRFVKLEDERGARRVVVFEFLQSTWHVSLIFAYIIIPVSFRKLISSL